MMENMFFGSDLYSNLVVSYAEISSYFIIFHHISSYFIIFHHMSSYFIIFHHISISDELYQQHSLTGAKRREWMGCWGLLG